VGHIEFLSDRALGETRIGGNEAIIAGLLSSVLEPLRQIDLAELANEPWGLPSPDTLSAGPPVAHATTVGRLQAEL
jgi:hypothetical protein